jgi:hypothetical protein
MVVAQPDIVVDDIHFDLGKLLELIELIDQLAATRPRTSSTKGA